MTAALFILGVPLFYLAFMVLTERFGAFPALILLVGAVVAERLF